MNRRHSFRVLLAIGSATLLAGCFEMGEREIAALYERNGTGCPLIEGKTYVALGYENGSYPEYARFTILPSGGATGCVVREIWTSKPIHSDGLKNWATHRFARLANGDLISWASGSTNPNASQNPSNRGIVVGVARFQRDGTLAEKSNCRAREMDLAAEPSRRPRLRALNLIVYPKLGFCRLERIQTVTAILDDPDFETVRYFRPVD